MASPVRDGLATVNNWTGTTSKTITLTTALPNDVICVAWSTDNTTGVGVSPATITGIASPSGLVFTRVFRSLVGAVNPRVAVELWIAPSAPALTAEVLTVTLDKAPDDCCLAAFGINGVNSITSPLDTDPSLPVTGSTGSTTVSPPPTLTYSTTQSNDLILYAHAALNSAGIQPTGWTLITSLTNAGGASFSSLMVASLSVSAAQSGATVTAPGGGNSIYAAGLTAFTADSAAPPAGVQSSVSIIW